MKTSNETKNLVKALFDFQGKVNAVKKTAKNDHFQSKYADLNSILTTINPVCQELGLLITQHPHDDVLVTKVYHVESGEWMQSEQLLRMRDANNPQQYGSALTYSRRYALASIFNLNQADDDGNSASGHQVKAVKEWLTPKHTMWIHAVEHMKKGKPIKDIEAQYALQPDVKQQLMDIRK
jgi:hypothetical protein